MTHPIPAPLPWPTPPAPAPVQLTLTSYDLLWLAMGGTINDTTSNTQIRLEPATCRAGAFLRASDAATMKPDLTTAAKEINTTIVSSAGLPVEGPAPTAEQLSDEVQAGMDAEIA